MKFIHVGDVHIDGNLEANRGWLEERRKDIKTSLFKVVELANKEKVDFLFFTGDVFDAPPSQAQLEAFDDVLSGLNNTWTFIIAGNHDYLGEDSPYMKYQFQSKTYLFRENDIKCVRSKETNTFIYGYSYYGPQETKEVYANAKPYDRDGYHILLAHGGDKTHIPINQEELKWSGFDYIALGHIHEPRVIAEDLMCYAGSLEPLDRTETGSHGVFLGEFTRERHLVRFVPMSQKSYVELNVSFEPGMNRIAMYQQIHEDILNYGINQMFTLYLQGDKKSLVKLDHDMLYEKYHIVDIIEDVLEESLDKKEEQPNIVVLVKEKLKDKPEALKYALEGLLHD